ncbi:hypothetical protein Tdes44962_MAKER06210 [Teratosphaeria destructans]|uniref:Uncharacterized protein n=1 Tax=Teratosphaeria destructans TaxID=418781 RepID=A0A9W7SHW2_9PEZI|nr:hypothetical protein Tdes44962_MAKER06210 [Teratosphaeria destructans]
MGSLPPLLNLPTELRLIIWEDLRSLRYIDDVGYHLYIINDIVRALAWRHGGSRALMLTCRALYAESKDLPAQIHPTKCRVTVWPSSKEYAFLPNFECGRKGQPLIMTEILGPIETCRILKEAREVDVHVPKGMEDNGEIKASVETILKSITRRDAAKVHSGR